VCWSHQGRGLHSRPTKENASHRSKTADLPIFCRYAAKQKGNVYFDACPKARVKSLIHFVTSLPPLIPGGFLLDQSGPIRVAMAGIDWTRVIGIACCASAAVSSSCLRCDTWNYGIDLANTHNQPSRHWASDLNRRVGPIGTPNAGSIRTATSEALARPVSNSYGVGRLV
jgi:hypothetical protein